MSANLSHTARRPASNWAVPAGVILTICLIVAKLSARVDVSQARLSGYDAERTQQAETVERRQIANQGLRMEMVAEVTNLFKRINVFRVNDTVCAGKQQPGSINWCAEFLTGSVKFKGRAGLPRQRDVRQFQFGLKLAF